MHEVDKILVRNCAALFIVLVCCTSALIYVLVSGDRAIAKSDVQLTHTYNVINDAQSLSAMLEAMLAAQRGFIITNDDKFLDRFHLHRDRISELVANLTELTSDNKSQSSRLDELRHHFNEFSVNLEKRAQTFTITRSSKVILNDVEEIDDLKDNILRINRDILREEYNSLDGKIKEIEKQKSKYFMTLLLGICATSVVLLLSSAFLFNTQRRYSFVQESLKNTEERFALAVEGTRDGIFDWDIKRGRIFYSKQLFGMLGDDRGDFIGTTEDLERVVHPDDSAQMWGSIDSYLKGETPEYAQEFRLRHRDGRWVWIHSRAKASFDENGKPLRLVGAHTDITYIKEHQARLEGEKKVAEEASRAKRDFLAHMSHEIRTPLTAISGVAEIFQNKQGNFDDRQKKLVRTLYASTGMLKDLINDILDVSKIESGELELHRAPFKLDSLFEEVISMMALRANEKGISFIFDFSNVGNMDFWGDKLRLRQIIVNLIGNAIKFTSTGGVKVKVYKQVRDAQEYLMIDIVDTGIGIAPENFEMIFERFRQADSSVSRRYGGTGLGLPISQSLAHMMDGNIVLSSELGKGTTFTVCLPIRKGQEDDTASETYIPATVVAHKKNPKWQGDENKVLMVEDYDGNIVVIGHLLDDIGCHYDVARTGAQALDLWERNKYAIILMDIQMPEMDGFSATKEIREREKRRNFSATPIIGMTAHALEGDKDKCILAGMTAYLPKPIVESDFKRIMINYLKEKRKIA